MMRIWAHGLVTVLLAGTLAQARVRLSCDRPVLFQGEGCFLQADLPETGAEDAHWSLQGPGAASPALKALSRTEAWLAALPSMEGGSFTVVVEDGLDPSVRAQAAVPGGARVRNGWGGPGPGHLGPGPVPVSPPYADAAGPSQRLRGVRIAFACGGFAQVDAALGRLDRCWILAGAEGLRAYGLAGEAVPVPEGLQPPPGHAVRALAVLPPGPCAAGAPRLVYAAAKEDPETQTRIFVLGADGVLREWAPGWAEQATTGRTVRDLALDQDGRVLVAFADGRDILRVEWDGTPVPYARLPEQADPGVAGVLAMVLDPVTGDLYVGDGSGVHRIAPSGASNPVLGPGAAGPAWSGSPSAMALCGRELLLVDTDRRTLHAFHLDRRELAGLLAPADSPGPDRTRFGPLRRFQPSLPAAACSALGEAGALAATPEGRCLLAVGHGLATLTLPGERPAPAVPPAAARRPVHPPPDPVPAKPITRQEKLEHFRAVQAEIRTLKKQARLVRRFRLQAEAKARERAFRAWRGRVEASRKKEPKRSAEARPGAWRQSRTGLLVLVAGGMVYLLDPSSMHAWAQPAYVNDRAPVPASGTGPISHLALGSDPGSDLLPDLTGFAAARAAIGNVGPACAHPLAGLLGLQACGTDYQAGVLAQIDDLETQTLQLFVPPQTLGVGCRTDGSPTQDPELSKLFQSSRSLQYQQLNANALALRYQFLAVGLEFRAVGLGLLSGQSLATPFARNRTLVAATPSLVFAETGDSLNLVGSLIESAGNEFGVVAAEAQAYQVDYQTWAQCQTEGLSACTEAGASLPSAAPAPSPRSPLPILADLLARPHLCLVTAGQYGVDASYCGGPVVAQLQARNGTLASLYQQAACLGASNTPGCPPVPQAGAGLDGAIALLKRYAAQLNAARYLGLAIGDGIAAGGESLRLIAEPLDFAGDVLGAAGSFAGADLLFSIGAAVRASAFDLESIGAAELSRAAALGLQVNAERWAQLDQEGARDPAHVPVSSTGTGLTGDDAAGSSSAQAKATDTGASQGPLATSSTAGRPPGSTPTAPTASAAIRVRALLLLPLVLHRITPWIR